jgi:2-oxo-4-hydroxy-4-carboxy-5-ureidoimidazoline decarboxylase
MEIDELNRLDVAQFVARLGGVYEHSPWVAEEAWRRRPFASVAALFEAMQSAVAAADRERQLALVRAHPELAGREAAAGAMTGRSTGEQGRLGFLTLSADEFQRMAGLNRRYRDKFGFPCIVALALHASRDSVRAEMARALEGEPASELARALEQIGHIARRRLEGMFEHGKTDHPRP